MSATGDVAAEATSSHHTINGTSDNLSQTSDLALEAQPQSVHQAASRPPSSAHSVRFLTSDNMYVKQEAKLNGDGPTHGELPPLQDNGTSPDFELALGDDPRSFELLEPGKEINTEWSLEKASQTLFSRDHLQVIFANPAYLLQFTTFLGVHRPASVGLLVHYLDSLKSLRAIHYANAICEGLDPVDGLDFTMQQVKKTINTGLEARANAAFDILAREELPAFICHKYIQVVSTSITARITGSLSPQLRESSEGLAEVFCLTDPSRQDNPIIFASEGE